jgi:DNA-binding CsgD family transcriptional regulator
MLGNDGLIQNGKTPLCVVCVALSCKLAEIGYDKENSGLTDNLEAHSKLGVDLYSSALGHRPKEPRSSSAIGLVLPPPGVEGQSMEHFEAFPKLRARAHDLLTTRERQIVLVLSEGATNREIGRRLRLAEGTVKVHLHHIYRKLGIPNRTTLAVLAHAKTKTLHAA